MASLTQTAVRSNGSGFNDVIELQNSSGTKNAVPCRAWINFNGTANNLGDLIGSGTYTQAAFSDTVIVTLTSHGLVVGNKIYFDATSGATPDAYVEVSTVDNANTFRFISTNIGIFNRSGNCDIYRNVPTITDSFNISSIIYNGVGDYTITFTNAMPNANYAVLKGLLPGYSTNYNLLNLNYRTSGSNQAGNTPTTKTTTQIRVTSGQSQNNALRDCADISLMVFSQ